MTEKELKKLSRADLLEMLIDQGRELQTTRQSLNAARQELEKREITIRNAGSIAEASLQLNGIFEAAQESCRQYLENIQLRDQESLRRAEQKIAETEQACTRMERESQRIAEQKLAEADRRCARMEAESQQRCMAMTAEAEAFWAAAVRRVERLCAVNADVRLALGDLIAEKQVKDL